MSFWQKWSKLFRRIPLWSVGAVLGIGCLLVGVADGQLTEMYRKAVMICLECIGIG